ncbi:dGTP triphosphohydrolase [Leadbetterella sp. DM7]|uniref:dGTP triphosphohydrolase n=1 Tax=Leadbetterella sp. DM7 TaxID=3235085 RepID=UPI00349E7EE1
MNWEQLYSNKRLASSSPVQTESGRGDYIRDYDRVIFSSPFRKLQNKTQVFPLPGAFFVHNRLTHSLEVASVGRSLGKLAGEKIAEKYKGTFSKASDDFYRFELSDVIQTACLAHDIGNPPFGHFGEEAIRAFFEDFFARNGDLGLNPQQQRDFTRFEGNANAFRILTTLFVKAGLKLTYTTLASVVKYPADSLQGFDKTRLATKKSGFMHSEAPFFREIAAGLGIPEKETGYVRHPFVYLVEAADDICYRVIDLEDAFKLKVVGFREVLELLQPLLNGSAQEDYLEKKLKSIADEEQKLSLLRALLINHLTRLCTEAFLAHEPALLNGDLDHSLIDLLDEPLQQQLRRVTDFSVKRIYNHHSVIEKELAGHHVIYGLLEDFANALLAPASERSKKVLRLLPVAVVPAEDNYVNLQRIADHISQMTDDFAMDLYKKIRGIF